MRISLINNLNFFFQGYRNMYFFDLIDKRLSVRKFSNESIPEEVLTNALEAAVLAANSSNLRPC